jgi:hypothetical protein
MAPNPLLNEERIARAFQADRDQQQTEDRARDRQQDKPHEEIKRPLHANFSNSP